MNNYRRFRYRFWVIVSRIGHSLFRLGQWQSFKAQDKIGGRHRQETHRVREVLDFVSKSLYNTYIAIKIAINNLNKEIRNDR